MQNPQNSATSKPPNDDRPPVGAVPLLGVAEPFQRLRRTVHDRPLVRPEVWRHAGGGIPVVDPYVRRYWTPVLGPGAIADLLRLATAAERRRSLPRPVYLSSLIRAGMVAIHDGAIRVRTRVPEVPRHLRHTLPPALRRELADRPERPFSTETQPSRSFGASKASA